MARLIFRQARLYDVPALARVERNSFVSPWSADDITRDVAFNDRAFVGVAELDGEVIGYADMWIVAGEAQLFNIAVDPSYRGNEIGLRLLDYMLRVASENCRIITLEVRRSNVPALNLYRRVGFRDVGVRKGYYTDNGEDAILMDKDLDVEISTSGEDALEVDIETI